MPLILYEYPAYQTNHTADYTYNAQSKKSPCTETAQENVCNLQWTLHSMPDPGCQSKYSLLVLDA